MLNGTVFGVLHDLQHGEDDGLAAICQAPRCTNGLIYETHEFFLRSSNCPKCGGKGWVYK